jgi:hypothetical protein
MLLSRKTIKWLEERFSHGAHTDQARVGAEYLPKVKQDRDEAERTALAVKHNWHARNAEWGESTLPVPPGDGDGGHPYDGDPFERSEDSRLAALFRNLGWVATSFEFVTAGYAAQFWLNVSTDSPVHLTPRTAAAIGVVVAGAYTYLAKGLWGIGPQDHSNHRPEFKRRERILWGVGIANVLAFASLGVDRFLDAPDWVYSAQLGVLSALLPIFASGCFVLGRLMSERNRLAAKYWSIQSHSERLKAIYSRISELLKIQHTEEVSHE